MKRQLTLIGLVFASLMSSKNSFAATYCHIKGTPLAREKGTAPVAGQQPVPNYVPASTKNLTQAETSQACNAMLDQDWDGKSITTETAPQNLYADHGITLLTDSCAAGAGTECFCSNTQLLGICLKPVDSLNVVCNCNTPLTEKETELFLADRKSLFETERQRLNDLWFKAVVSQQHGEQPARKKSYQDFEALTDKLAKKTITPWDPSIPEQFRLPTDDACKGKYPQAPCVCRKIFVWGGLGMKEKEVKGICGINKYAVNMKPYTLFCHCD